MKKFLLGISLFSLSFMACANEENPITFALINTSSSAIPNPIKITGGYFSYYFFGVDPECPHSDNPVTVDLSAVINMPLPIYLGTESKIIFKPDPKYQNCMVNGAFAELNITQVDGINKQNSKCAVANMSNYYDVAMNIEETTDNFYCSVVSLKK